MPRLNFNLENWSAVYESANQEREFLSADDLDLSSCISDANISSTNYADEFTFSKEYVS